MILLFAKVTDSISISRLFRLLRPDKLRVFLASWLHRIREIRYIPNYATTELQLDRYFPPKLINSASDVKRSNKLCNCQEYSSICKMLARADSASVPKDVEPGIGLVVGGPDTGPG